jgi:hypothetical protein
MEVLFFRERSTKWQYLFFRREREPTSPQPKILVIVTKNIDKYRAILYDKTNLRDKCNDRKQVSSDFCLSESDWVVKNRRQTETEYIPRAAHPTVDFHQVGCDGFAR